MTSLNPNKLKAQARACDDALRYVLTAAFVEGAPADRVLASFFKQNRKYGSRDRRLMRNAVFAVFRWWGWGRFLLPESLRSQGAAGFMNRKSAGTEKRTETGRDGRTAERKNTEGRKITEGDGRTAERGWSEKGEGEEISGEIVLHPRESALLLLLSHGMEDEKMPSIAQVWAERCDVSLDMISAAGAVKDFAERGRQLMAVLQPKSESDISEEFEPTPEALLPDWVMEHLSFPVPLAKAVAWLQKRPPIWIRLQYANPDDLTTELRCENVKLSFHKRITQAANAGHPQNNLYALKAFRKGAFEIQDIASQCVGIVCAPQPGERWWDACAGAGGKNRELAALMEGKGTIVATDIRTYKLKDLKKRARRPGVPNIDCRHWNGKRPRKKQANYDGVLVDSPCTCSGTWRRNPDARWSTSPNDLDELIPLQRRLLRNAAGGVKPGGVLVYATCSMLPQENRENIDYFLSENSEFELDPFDNPLTGEPTDGTLQIWPWDADCDAMYIARFRRTV